MLETEELLLRKNVTMYCLPNNGHREGFVRLHTKRVARRWAARTRLNSSQVRTSEMKQ